ncbi:hypothetical protein JOF40_003601 [Aeromicrobium fastidiosum]|nr:hypothetical protein [Aeromicrobium fastidiosum]
MLALLVDRAVSDYFLITYSHCPMSTHIHRAEATGP